jgi:hypothetical protein
VLVWLTAALTASVTVVASGGALAQQPVRSLPWVGHCPLGYYASGNYCFSSPSKEREAIQKTGNSCPPGWISSGSYWVKNR